MVRPGEPFAAFLASKTFLSGVCSQVTLEFVGSRERFVAEEPVADEGSQSSVPSEMCFEVTGFAVHFSTTCDMTHMLFWFVRFGRLTGHAVRTLAPTAATCDTDLLRSYDLRRRHLCRVVCVDMCLLSL